MNLTDGHNESHNGHTGMEPYSPLMPVMTGGSDSLFQIAWRGKWFILLSTILGGAGAYVYLQRATPLYTSTSRILVEKHGEQRILGAPQPLGSTSSNYLQTQASMITNPEIIAGAMRDPNVLTLPSLQDPAYARGVLTTLSAVVGKNTDILSISASAAHPEDAAQVVNAVVQAYIGWHKTNRQVSTTDLLKDLNNQLQKRTKELTDKYHERLLFEQGYPEIVARARGGGIDSHALDLLSQELASARSNAMQQESYCRRLQKVEEQEPNKFRQYVYAYGAQVSGAREAGDGERTRLTEELERMRLQLETVSAGGEMTKLSQVTLLQNRKAQIEERIAELDDEFVQNHLALAKSLAEDARAREQQLTEMYKEESGKVHNLGGRYSDYAFIVSQCTMLENMYNSLLNQINALDLNARFEGLTVHVLARALPATEPSSPQAARVLGIGLVLGLTIGVGLAFLRDWRDQRVRSADEITAILGVRVLGVVPSMSRRRAVAHGQGLRFASNSHDAEAYRAIRTSLFFGAPREQAVTVLVTSPGPLEGKTTLVSNLGIAMAQAGQKTLIVDGDLRKPRQHVIFGTNGDGRGLASVLTGTATLDEAIRSTEVPGLDVLASGKSVPNPSEILGGRVFAEVLGQLKRRYDRVLFDSAPIGLVTDSQILAASCDLTVLVLRARRSSRMLTQQARDALLTVRARLLGVVVNDVSKRDSRYSHYSLYSHYRGDYGSNGREATRMELPTHAAHPENGASTPEAQKGDGEATNAPGTAQGESSLP